MAVCKQPCAGWGQGAEYARHTCGRTSLRYLKWNGITEASCFTAALDIAACWYAISPG